MIEPWDYVRSSSRSYALGATDPLLAYSVWYRDLAGDDASRQRRWREFLMAEDPKEEVVRAGAWIVGEEKHRRRMHRPQARATVRRRGRPLKPPPGAEGF